MSNIQFASSIPSNPLLNANFTRTREFDRLFADPQIQDYFIALFESVVQKNSAEVAKSIANDSEKGLKALEAALLFGGLLHKPAFEALFNEAQNNNLLAKEILRHVYDKRALYPGSFDLFTLGHRDVVIRAATIFDEVIIGIGVNHNKKSLFSPKEKEAYMVDDLADAPGNFQVVTYSCLTHVLADELGVKTLIRGVRGITDMTVEQELGDAFRRGSDDHNLDTIFIPTKLELTFTSSSIARTLSAFRGGDPLPYVSPKIGAALVERHMQEYLNKKWSEVFGSSDVSKEILANVLAKYSEPHRKYHNMQHLFEMFSLLDEVLGEDKSLSQLNLKEIGAAIFFHDLEYNPQSSDNEEQSALQATSELKKLDWPIDKVERVDAMIRASRTHELLDPSDKNLALFLDLDLSILGASNKRYIQYTQQIREEYKHRSDEDLRTIRPQIMQRFLDRNPLYHTPIMHIRFERKAKSNVENEITRLKAGILTA